MSEERLQQASRRQFAVGFCNKEENSELSGLVNCTRGVWRLRLRVKLLGRYKLKWVRGSRPHTEGLGLWGVYTGLLRHIGERICSVLFRECK